MENQIFIPGTDKQLKFLLEKLSFKNDKILIVGSSSEFIAQNLSEKTTEKIELIVEDYDSLINSKLIVDENSNINIRLMDFEITDFDEQTFDLIFAQGSISNHRRNKIVKHLKKLLKPNGLFLVGEVVKLQEKTPPVLDDIWESSDLEPIFTEDISEYYKTYGFTILEEKDISETLTEYYSTNLKKLKETEPQLTDQEKSYYKKLLNRVSHESTMYLKHGGDKHIGFKILFMKKDN